MSKINFVMTKNLFFSETLVVVAHMRCLSRPSVGKLSSSHISASLVAFHDKVVAQRLPITRHHSSKLSTTSQHVCQQTHQKRFSQRPDILEMTKSISYGVNITVTIDVTFFQRNFVTSLSSFIR